MKKPSKTTAQKQMVKVICLSLALSILVGMSATCSSDSNISGSETTCAHRFSQMEIGAEHLAVNATEEYVASYYYSCIHCGMNGTTTFLPNVEESRERYTPSCFTMAMYETLPNLSYGMTWNCLGQPVDPVVAYRKMGEEEFSYISATVTEMNAYALDNSRYTVYVMKAVCPLEFETNYEYKVGDLAAGVYTQLQAIKTVNPTSKSFKFASVSDTQAYASKAAVGEVFDESKYMQNAFAAMGDMDFYLHSGDIIEESKYEDYWKGMLNSNFNYLSKTPVMIGAGNHDTIYKSAEGVLYNHFHNNLATVAERNIFYSFDYGNVKFIVLDTNVGGMFEIGKEQYLWLTQTLMNNTQKWTIVMMHCPMYSAGQWGSNLEHNSQSLNLRSSLTGIFAKYGVDLVIQGHDHVVSKTYPIDENKVAQKEETQRVDGIDYVVEPNGTIYIMNGTSGNGTRSPQPTYEKEYYDYLYGSHASSWAEYIVEEDKLTVRVKYYSEKDNKIYDIDSFGILK